MFGGLTICVAGKSFRKRGNFLFEASQVMRQHWRGLVRSRTGIHVPLNGRIESAPFSFPLAWKGNMKNSKIAWLLIAIFALSNIAFASLYLSEKHSLQRTQIALNMTEKSQSEFKANVQAAVDAQSKQNVQSELIDSVYGVYNCPDVENFNQFDLRSDGTAVFYLESQDGEERIWGRNGTWELDANTIWVKKSTGELQRYTIEQDDLIDKRGN